MACKLEQDLHQASVAKDALVGTNKPFGKPQVTQINAEIQEHTAPDEVDDTGTKRATTFRRTAGRVFVIFKCH